MSEPTACPLCGEPLYGWIAQRGDERQGAGTLVVLDRCENCGVALARGSEIDLSAEWQAVCEPGDAGGGVVAVPDRASLQASIGGDRWAALGLAPGRLLLTRDSLARLARHNGFELEQLRWPMWGRNQTWMWQTFLNGLTFHRNFAREVRAGRLSARTAQSRLRFVVDMVVTALGAPLVALASVPLELAAALFRRGGELRAVARHARQHPSRAAVEAPDSG